MLNDTMYTGIAIGIAVALFAAVLGAIGALYNRLRAVEVKMAEVTMQISPLWARVQAQISKDLHHPHPRYLEMDTLLEKLESMSISLEERSRLRELLAERAIDMHPDITDEQRKSARAMIPVMELVMIEAEDNKRD